MSEALPKSDLSDAALKVIAIHTAHNLCVRGARNVAVEIIQDALLTLRNEAQAGQRERDVRILNGKRGDHDIHQRKCHCIFLDQLISAIRQQEGK